VAQSLPRVTLRREVHISPVRTIFGECQPTHVPATWSRPSTAAGAAARCSSTRAASLPRPWPSATVSGSGAWSAAVWLTGI